MSSDRMQNKILHRPPPPSPPKKFWKDLWKTDGLCFVILPAGHSKSNTASSGGADDNNDDKTISLTKLYVPALLL
jgi:hypothetical protein